MGMTGRAILALVLAGGLGAGGYYGWLRFEGVQQPASVLTLYGNVDVRQVSLAFQVFGQIDAVPVEEGDRVATGDLLARLEADDLRDQVRLALARVETAAATLAALEAGTRSEEIAQARAIVARTEAAVALARTTLNRQAELAARNVASHQAHEAAQAAYDEAVASRDAAQAALTLALAGPRAEDIRRARATLDAERAGLSQAQRQLGFAELIAPNDGVILSRVREPGSIVAPGEPILSLSLSTPVWVRTYVDEPDLGYVVPGAIAEIRTDSGGIYSGQVGFISPVAEFTPKSVETRELRTSLVYRLRVIVENPDDGLRQGMPVTVILPLEAG